MSAVGVKRPLLETSGLSVSFGPLRALSDVDLTVGSGELLAVTAEPGSGMTTLIRSIAGDLQPAGGEIRLAGQVVPADPVSAGRLGIGVVWQELQLAENLDVAGNLMLGRETPRLMFSESRLHAAAANLLAGLHIPIVNTTGLVSSLSAGERQLLAMAKAIALGPRLLLLDEPTASLGAAETLQVEQLITRLRDQGMTILLASRDIEQVFRIADRIVVIRHGRRVAGLDPQETHPDDVAALRAGHKVDVSARQQLTRLHGLADSLVSADPSSSLSLILSALGAALAAEMVCIHVVNGEWLECAASLGFTPAQIVAFSRLRVGPEGGPAGRAAATRERVVEADLRGTRIWAGFGDPVSATTIAGSWSLPVTGPAGVSAVITVFKSDPGAPGQDELDLLALYSGYVAGALERDRLLDQVTARNRVLETIRETLEILAGPVVVGEALTKAVQVLGRGLRAAEVGLLTRAGEAPLSWRAYAGPDGTDPATASEELRAAALQSLEQRRDGCARELGSGPGRRVVAVPFNAPAGPTTLVAGWSEEGVTEAETALIEDAAHSLNLALEREEAGFAHEEAVALRRSRALQRGFLSRLSHELRTPLTAIRGYASSLRAPDVTWDDDSKSRFLDRIAAESARLGRLVDDLLDFSAIESGVMRLQRDWCDVPLVVEAAVGCLPAEWSASVSVTCEPTLPAVWADHDRLEQVFVNLLNNAFCHNPAGTRVSVTATAHGGEIEIRVIDDGTGFPAPAVSAPFDTAHRQRSSSAGAGLGLSIARGIVDAHSGQIELTPAAVGTTFRIRLPVEAAPGAAGEAHPPRPALVDHA